MSTNIDANSCRVTKVKVKFIFLVKVILKENCPLNTVSGSPALDFGKHFVFVVVQCVQPNFCHVLNKKLKVTF